MSPKTAARLEERLKGAEEHIREIRAFLAARATDEYRRRLGEAASDADAGIDADQLLKELRSA